MGAGSSNIDENAFSWLVAHSGSGSLWYKFVMRSYSAGVAATGVPMATSLPLLLRASLQSWLIQGLSVHLGVDYVRFGRQLASRDSDPTHMFHGVSIGFGDHSDTSASWFSDSEYCTPSEWRLRLHKAFLEPVPESTTSATAVMHNFPFPGLVLPAHSGNDVSRPVWPGRGRHLCEEDGYEKATSSATSIAARGSAHLLEIRDSKGFFGASATLGSSNAITLSSTESECIDQASSSNEPQDVGGDVEQQLSMFFSNADYHMGLLCLPVPDHCIARVAETLSQWRHLEKATFGHTGQPLVTEADFADLRENAIYMPDLLLLGLEPDLASTLTPDWTWAKYPQGCGEVTISSSMERPHPSAQTSVAETVANPFASNDPEIFETTPLTTSQAESAGMIEEMGSAPDTLSA